MEHHGTVFSGEAPESDDEILAFSSVKLGAAREMTEVYQPSPVKMVQKPILGKTLLQKLLGEFFYFHFISTGLISPIVTVFMDTF